MQFNLATSGNRKLLLTAVAVVTGTLAYGSVGLAASASTASGTPAAPSVAVPSVTVPVPAVSGLPGVVTTAPAPTTRQGAQTQPAKPAKGKKKPLSGFVGSINASNINIRSGPGLAYYALGQLTTGDMVNVVGTRNGWDAIDPPVGTLCYIAKKFVHVGTDTAKGHVSANYVFVRAASRLAPRSDYAVVKIVSRGTRVHIVGSTPSFYVIQPPRGAHVYVLAKFVTSAGANAQYLAPKLRMPAGFKGATLAASLAAGNSAVLASATANTPSSVTTKPVSPALLPNQTVPLPVSGGNSGQSGQTVVVPPVPPRGAMPNSAKVGLFSKFSNLNRKTQLEFQKPLMQRRLEPLLQGYQDLAAVAGAPLWIKQGVAARIRVLKREIAIQELVETSHKTPPVSKVIAPYQQQWKESQAQIAQAIDHAPYLAKGVLRTSTALKSKYALVNPANGRVTAYIDPTSRIDLSRLLGEYIGIKGVVTGGGTVVKVIRVATATLLPKPTIRHLSAGQQHP